MARGGANGRFQLGTTHSLPKNIRDFATGVWGGRQRVAATYAGMHSGVTLRNPPNGKSPAIKLPHVIRLCTYNFAFTFLLINYSPNLN